MGPEMTQNGTAALEHKDAADGFDRRIERE